jgi:Mn-containing catalase
MEGPRMFYHDKRTQYTVRVEQPNPLYAKMLQQGLGGIEGEIRVMLQYLFQAWNSRGASKYRDMLLETGTEEMGHVEMYATAIALNLEGSPAATQEEAARKNPLVAAVMGGMSPRQYLSAGMGAVCQDSEGNPFNGSWVVGSGNIAADMFSNTNAEATGIALACRLYEMTDDPGMKDMLKYLIARDVMHQQQWLAVIEELGGFQGQLPIPNSFDHSQEMTKFSHAFFSTAIDGIDPPEGRWTSGPSLDGKGEYTVMRLRPMGEEPQLAPPIPQAFAQVEQMQGGKDRVANHGASSQGMAAGGSAGTLGSEGIGARVKDALSTMANDVTGRGRESGTT